ncbi:restriction endonuclease subunit S [Citricoccus sp. NPDC055426]|uniref:restriction endonuclease subunit S n=1 Tax=Citricoccus sp. NPDC055426 TaxID=3155536 RepID=UPI003421880E
MPTRYPLVQVRRLAENLDYQRIPLNASERASRFGSIPYWGANSIVDHVDEHLVSGPLVLIGEDGAPFFDPMRPVAFAIDEPIWPNNHVHVLRARPWNDHRYLAYALNTVDYRIHIKGSTRDKLNQADLSSIQLPAPDSEQQRAVADYLDHETAEIDAFLEDLHQLQTLSDEQRASRLASTLTGKSLPKSRQSINGARWFDSIPDDWQAVKIRHLTPVLRGASPRPINDPIYFDENGHYSWVRISDVTNSNGRLTHTSQRLSTLGSSRSVPLEPGSLFLSIAATVGKPCITEIPACIHDGFVYFPEAPELTEWLFAVFEAGLCFAGLGKLGTQLNLNTDSVGDIMIPLPSPSDQQAMLQVIQQQRREAQSIKDDVQEAIDLVKERRAALISAAVTGQIDVPGRRRGPSEAERLESELARTQ